MIDENWMILYKTTIENHVGMNLGIENSKDYRGQKTTYVCWYFDHVFIEVGWFIYLLLILHSTKLSVIRKYLVLRKYQ